MPSLGQGRRRKMLKFELNELSAVDVPAQEGARALIMKRKGEPGYRPDEKDPKKRGRADSGDLSKFEDAVVVLTDAVDGHTHAVWMRPGMAGGETGFGSGPEDEMGHSHPWVMSGGGLVIGENDGHSHEVAADAVMSAMLELATKRSFTAEERERLAESGAAMPDGSFPIETVADLKNAVSAFGRAKDKAKAARHIAERAKILDAMDVLPDDGELADLIGKSHEGDSEMDEKVKKQLDEANEKLDELTKRAERAESIAKLNPEQRAHFDALEGEAADEFLGKSEDERAEIVKAAADADRVVYKSSTGAEFRASDDPRLVEMAKQADADRRARIEAEKRVADEGLRKRADEVLKHSPGTLDERVEVLRAVEAIAEPEQREAAIKCLKAGDDALKAAFDSRGTTVVGETDGDSPQAELDAAVKRYAKEHDLEEAQAYSKFLDTPEGSRLYTRTLN